MPKKSKPDKSPVENQENTTMPPITLADAPTIIEHGITMESNPAIFHLLKMDDDFEIDTGNGILGGVAGDFVALDESRGYLWLVKEHDLQYYSVISLGADGHAHRWVPGVLPGNVYVKLCTVYGCTSQEKIDRAEWDQLRWAEKSQLAV